MKKKITVLILLHFGLCFGQKEANIWYFGNKAGIDFNDPCNPVALTNGTNFGAFEGSSTISDENTGELLFYTDGYWIYNKSHAMMTNGYLNSNSASQTLILKKPNSSSIFYVLTPELQGNVFGNNYGLRCAIVDMTLNGGLGDVTNGNSQFILNSPVTEKLTATRHANGIDIWIITHTYNNNNFVVFLLDSNGINANPIISSVGSNHNSISNGNGAIGEMRVSPNGQKIAAVNFDATSVLELFDFDNLTGQISNPISLNPAAFSYGLSFSPDNSKLYVTSEPFPRPSATTISTLYQFDLSSNNPTTIANSKVVIFTAPPSPSICGHCGHMGSLKIAPDNKIYVGRGNQIDSLGVINFPNLLGVNCNYVHNGFYLNGGKVVIGLNNAMEINYDECDRSEIKENEETFFVSQVYPNPFSNKVTFSISENEQAIIILYDMLNQEVFRQTFTTSETINTEKFADGIYFFQLYSNKKITKTGKIIKQFSH